MTTCKIEKTILIEIRRKIRKEQKMIRREKEERENWKKEKTILA